MEIKNLYPVTLHFRYRTDRDVCATNIKSKCYMILACINTNAG